MACRLSALVGILLLLASIAGFASAQPEAASSTCGATYCDDSNPCTVNACSETEGCIYIAAADGTVCSADGAMGRCTAAMCVPIQQNANPEDRKNNGVLLASLSSTSGFDFGSVGASLAMLFGDAILIALLTALIFAVVFIAAAYSAWRISSDAGTDAF